MLTGATGPTALKVQDAPAPRPGPGQVAVDVRAAGVNFSDLMATQGLYPEAPATPAVLGYEVAGTVAEGGAGFAAGDRVIAIVPDGGWAERVAVDAASVMPLPAGMSFAQGAAVPVNYGTAYAALFRYGALVAGERALVHCAAGGVGVAATQLAKLRDVEVWGTASAAKHEAIAGNGVDHPLDYRRRGWHRGVPSLDLVLDPLGGRSLRRSYRLLRAGGRLVCLGASDAVSGPGRDLAAAAWTYFTGPRFDPLRHLMQDSKTVIGLHLVRLWRAVGLAQLIDPIRGLLGSDALSPVVYEEVPFDRAPDALRILAERRNVGKVVLVP